VAPAPLPGLDGLLARCVEIATALPPDAVFCHETALGLHGIDLPWGTDLTGDLHVALPPGPARARRLGVRGHRYVVDGPDDVVRSGGLRVFTADAAWVQLAGQLSVREIVVLGDALTRRKRPWCTPAALEARVAALPAGTRGVRRLREAVALVRARTDSCMESRLRYLLVAGGLPCPLVNYEVRDADGWLVAMPDLAYPDLRIALEYDGDVHRTDRRTWQRDIARRQALEALGWRVITCTADDVLHFPDRTLSWVRAAIRSQRGRPPSGQ
jgi:G:T-mismatch repair DNA endonuclease (very short patch repair protein)